MPVTVYRSTDSGAPPLLTNVAGSFVAILDACLVNGYGAKSAAGWTKAFTGTNKAAYRMSTTPPSTGFYLRVDDSNVSQSRVLGYESMTDVDTGTDAFPTDTQVSGGMYALKTAANPAWVLIADERAFYFFYRHTGYNIWLAFFFGDIVSRVASDPYACAIAGRTGTVGFADDNWYKVSSNLTSTTDGHYISRNYNGTTKSANFVKISKFSQNYMGDNGFPYPNPADNGLYMDRMMVIDGSSSKIFRGYLPGCWNPLHANLGNQDDTFSGAAELAGRTFLIIATYGGRTVIETSNTWRS
jgi:hypothetical protein